MGVELIGLHWVYVLFMVGIIGFMIALKDTTIVSIAGIFVLGLMAAGSLSHSVIGVFISFIYAIKELLGTILVISIIVGMSLALTKTGIVMMIISWFFWPSPAVAERCCCRWPCASV